jgi:catechol 2,3-dioxygenase-like lactoylglutathione lyase family enzyme
MRQKLNLITLGVNDLARSLKFYEKGLGWKKSPASLDDLALFPLGGIVLALYPRHLLTEDAGAPEDGSGFSGITLSFNAKSEKEVVEILAVVTKAGANIVKPAQKAFRGGTSSYFNDPDGHLIEVAYNPF